jgi:hypothetical protein
MRQFEPVCAKELFSFTEKSHYTDSRSSDNVASAGDGAIPATVRPAAREMAMFRNNLRRGAMAVVFAAVLALSGARPAAAQGLSWREAWDWLGSLWSGVTILQSTHEAAGPEIDPDGGPTANGDCGPEIDPDGRPRCLPPALPDCGPEIDPNGGCIQM